MSRPIDRKFVCESLVATVALKLDEPTKYTRTERIEQIAKEILRDYRIIKK